ncbi:LPS-assembly protein LptD [Magnetospirillum sp. SS-4]|uniref:LPS-assembly protein LptD n=1 Tax=Magnetospirillum sp. SS-4 TaxID=2681465 RepID=UPI00137EAE11|nr:LPS assembly protein LptD [Magnetospirillum sp. SS-4]CAA7627194.1 Organic solvent tolerance protein OstA [Magnetospirillum sp. SS-4]
MLKPRPFLLLTLLASSTALSGGARADMVAGTAFPEIGGWGQAWGDDIPTAPPPPQQRQQQQQPPGYRPPPAAAGLPTHALPAGAARAAAAPSGAPLFHESYPEVGGWGQAWGDDRLSPAAPPPSSSFASATTTAPGPATDVVPARRAAPPPPAIRRAASPAADDIDRDGDAVGLKRPPRIIPRGTQAGLKSKDTGDTPVHMLADQLVYDREYGIVTATGRVEMQQAGRTITADTVTYNLKQDVMGASGNVILTEPTGEVTHAEYFELTGDFKNGVARDIRLILADNSRLAAQAGQRVGGDRTDFDRVVYTACEPCKDKPDATPIWQAKAARVTHNQAEAQVEYRDAWIELAGIPVLYTPYLSHPDPSVKRKTGFLAPSVGFHSKLGPSLSTPYFFALADNQDVTLIPRFMAPQTKLPKDGSVSELNDNAMKHLHLTGEHRWLGKRGEMKTRASITTDRITGDVRGHVESNALFELNRTWRAGWQVQHQSDQTYRSLYKVRTDTERPWLVTRPYVEGFGRRNYALAESILFQGNTVVQDGSKSPVVLPHVMMQNISEPGWAGSYWSFDSDVLAYTRDRGTDARRLSHRTAWNLPLTTPDGQVLLVSASLRGDAYQANGLATTSDGKSSVGRVIPEASINWRYPFSRPGTSVSQVIEPVATVAISPIGGNSARFPNEDSLGFELDETNVLRTSRVVGLDRVEGGLRGGYGLRYTAYPATGGMIGIQAAQGWRQHVDSTFGQGSGFTGSTSDYLGRLDIRPTGYLTITDRIRLDKSSLQVRRNEAGLTAGPQAFNVSATYGFLSSTTNTGVSLYPRRQYAVYGLNSALTQYWRSSFSLSQDLEETGGVLNWTASTVYSDECLAVIGSMNRYYSTAPGLLSGYSVMLTIVLKSLGEAPVGLF